MIPSNLITIKAWIRSYSPNSPVTTRESHWNNTSSCPSRSTTFSAVVTPTVCPHSPLYPQQLTQTWNPCKLAWHASVRRRERDAFDRVYDCIADCLDILTSCPTRPSRNPVAMSVISKSATSLEIAVTLEINGKVIETVALIDSGAAGNLIVSFAKNNSIPLVPCDSHLAVAALDGRPLGSGCIKFTTEISNWVPDSSTLKPSACLCSNLHKPHHPRPSMAGAA